jgi:hypothetical protein
VRTILMRRGGASARQSGALVCDVHPLAGADEAGIALALVKGTIRPESATMSHFASNTVRSLARAFLYLLAAQPAHRYPWMARPGKIRGQSTFSDRWPSN